MVTDQYVYSLFSEVYYDRPLRTYGNKECSVTESVQCLLKSFFHRKFRRTYIEPKIVILTFGDLVHKGLRTPLEKRGYTVEPEASIELPNGTLYAHSDAVNNEWTLEFKTISRYPTGVLSHHRLQDNAYNYIFKKDIGWVAYVHKPSGQVKVYPVYKRDEDYQYVLARAIRLLRCIQQNLIPEPEPSWLCQYCEYTDICPAPQQLKQIKGGI